MPNQEITTALKNSIERGESLQTAMQIMINSGYNAQEIQEASRYIGGGQIEMKAKPGEELTMPEKKGFFSRFKGKRAVSQKPAQIIPQQPVSPPKLPPQNTQTITPRQEAMKIRQQIIEPKPMLPQVEVSNQEEPEPLAKELSKLTPRKHKHGKEIMLLIILLVLIGLLILTIFLKDTIIGWFS